MTLFAGIMFGLSLFGIVILFAIKRYELARGALVGGSWRGRADDFALRVKWAIMVIEWYLARTPIFVSVLVRYGVRMAALGFANLARTSEAQAHRLAEMVSHKRNFERRETRSEFLKQVSEHKNGNGKDDGPVATR
ncbi:hypothetical protein A2765_05615 [Candidatus Kaiserbacteria bacterium RIFCSPHIGHO2_01_FULL_56_24]|uniref:Uncharacterized protein n=1 Tax=Candidatus Kaiserbacteria bacterium RIFCSPHIGHO2_01_FULL_56_24 TaxID=1798487 RepID=A0A1F6DAP9_9BACT|nr:MAG: hypothetical protein A2765_05615 [Candidatus Kaiserbacteria bacterium RIFCSPHIGHO2_01_FULL_56_24]